MPPLFLSKAGKHMAKFIAKFGKYRHGIRTGRSMVLADGQRQELTKDLMARFDISVVTQEEQELGIRSFVHAGLPEDRDTNEHFSPRSRISGFDSERAQVMYGWTDDERELVEYTLRNSPHYGDEFMEVTPQPAEKPWPTYDDVSDPDKIVEVALAIGIPLEDVIAYELENRKSAPVIDALYDALNPEEEAEDVLLIEA